LIRPNFIRSTSVFLTYLFKLKFKDRNPCWHILTTSCISTLRIALYVDTFSLLRSGVNFLNVLRTAFALVDPESVKNTVKSSVSFYAFGIYERKSCTYNVDDIEPRSSLTVPLYIDTFWLRHLGWHWQLRFTSKFHIC